MFEADSLRRHPVEVRGHRQRLPIAAARIPPLLIAEVEEDVRARRPFLSHLVAFLPRGLALAHQDRQGRGRSVPLPNDTEVESGPKGFYFHGQK